MSTNSAPLDAELVADDISSPGSDSSGSDSTVQASGNSDLELAIASDWMEHPLAQASENATAASSEPKDLSHGIPPIELQVDLEPIIPFSDRLDPQGQPLASGSDSAATPDFEPLAPEPPAPDPNNLLSAHPESALPHREIAIPADDPTTADLVESTPADFSAEDNSVELWGRVSSMHLPIHQYVPIIPRFETSTFYAKLRAVAASDELP